MQGGAKALFLAMGTFLLGAGVTGLWLHRGGPKPRAGAAQSVQHVVLSENTRSVLARLKSPVELRFYSLLDPASVSDSLKSFAGRVDGLVSEYERAANGKIKVTRFESQSYTNADSAVRDGIRAFNADKGDACFLGIALVLNDHRESLSRLAPEWEAALEPDLTRALDRLIEANRPPPPPLPVSQSQSNAVQEVKAMIPDMAAVSLQDGTRLLRESALKEFQTLAKESEARIKQAQQALADAQAGKSEAEQAAARKQLQQVQSEQMEKLKALAAKSQDQVEAFEHLKAAQ